jgi:uncharacterized protein involved in exopolysaccharide biosynthesis
MASDLAPEGARPVILTGLEADVLALKAEVEQLQGDVLLLRNIVRKMNDDLAGLRRLRRLLAALGEEAQDGH